MRFVVNFRESNLRTFCREIHQSAKIGGHGGGVKPILAMPGFSRLLLQPPLPKGVQYHNKTYGLIYQPFFKDIDIDKVIMKNIDIDKRIPTNIDIVQWLMSLDTEQ